MKQGVIFDIKEFSIFDGPGLRQTVFLKGCPLRCNWCHNPEGLSLQPQRMGIQTTCLFCETKQMVFSDNHCLRCGKVLPVVPRVVGELVHSDELVQRIKKNSAYYDRYGGGVTFSGGEPLLQVDFLLEVLDKLPDLHKAIQTSGYCNSEKFKQVINQLDLVMMDIKIMDSRAHQKYIGLDNQQILQNAKILCQSNTPFIIRIPVIPGVNDHEDNYRQTAEWIAGASHLERVELLPYHKTAGAKYSMVGAEYRPEFAVDQQVWISTRIFSEYGIRSEVL
jgi:pyruvate formate lyase activating enzyme